MCRWDVGSEILMTSDDSNFKAFSSPEVAGDPDAAKMCSSGHYSEAYSLSLSQIARELFGEANCDVLVFR